MKDFDYWIASIVSVAAFIVGVWIGVGVGENNSQPTIDSLLTVVDSLKAQQDSIVVHWDSPLPDTLEWHWIRFELSNQRRSK